MENYICPVCHSKLEFMGIPKYESKELYHCKKCGFLGTLSFFADDNSEVGTYFEKSYYMPEDVLEQVLSHWKSINEQLERAKQNGEELKISTINWEIEFENGHPEFYGGNACPYCAFFSKQSCDKCPYKKINGVVCFQEGGIWRWFAESVKRYLNKGNTEQKKKSELGNMIRASKEIIRWNVANRETILRILKSERDMELLPLYEEMLYKED